MTLDDCLKIVPETELFHYTTPEGLLGITESGYLWATIIHHLNDSKEFKHALEIFQYEVFQATEKLETERCSTAGSIGHALREALERTSKMSVAVASFSEKGDLLSQWRGYCPRGGFSLGFAPQSLAALAAANGFRLVRCIYNPTTQHEIARGIVADCLNSYRGACAVPGADKAKTQEGYCTYLIGEFARCAPIFKHHSFSEEAEWRIFAGASMTDPRMHVRASASRLVPYLEFKLSNSDGKIDLQKLIVGPSPNPDLAFDAASKFRFASSARLNLVQLSPSKVPLRLA